MQKLFVLASSIMMSACILLLTGCTKDPENDPNPDITASSDTISGIVKYKTVEGSKILVANWPFGPGMLRVVLGGETVANTALLSDGSFIVVLPGTVQGKNFTNLNDIAIIYGGTVKTTPETAKYVGSSQFIVDYTDNTVAKNMIVSQVVLNFNNSVYRNYYHYFYDGDGTVTGAGTAGNSINWAFTKGWGMVETNLSTGTPPYILSSKSVSGAAGNVVWTN